MTSLLNHFSLSSHEVRNERSEDQNGKLKINISLKINYLSILVFSTSGLWIALFSHSLVVLGILPNT